jgi:hypothetical protein
MQAFLRRGAEIGAPLGSLATGLAFSTNDLDPEGADPVALQPSAGTGFRT